jgi:NAD+ synthetase
VAALGKDHVVGVAMPSRYSSEHSISDARAMAEALGISFTVLPIGSMHDAFEAELAGQFEQLALRHATLGDDLAEQNVQARIRGVTLMAISNKFNHLLLTTGNKSELATGYCTLYGDMCGGLAVISDVPKTTVWRMSRWINTLPAAVRATKLPAVSPIIPVSTIEKVPSAELKPNQTDQDSLPPYELLDEILYRYVDEEKGARQIIAEGYDAATVTRIIRMVDRSEYKRRQAAPGLKVTSRAFGFGRRMPIAQNYR